MRPMTTINASTGMIPFYLLIGESDVSALARVISHKTRS